MGLLLHLERTLGKLVNTVFARTFRAQIQPVEITAALKNEMDTQASALGGGRILVPGRYVIRVSEADANNLSRIYSTVLRDVTGALRQHALKQGYTYPGELQVRLEPRRTLVEGVLLVEGETSPGGVAWLPQVLVDKKRYTVQSSAIIGRSSKADIPITDPAASRQHARISVQKQRILLEDLGSTNGLKVNGVKSKVGLLSENAIITIGKQRLRVVVAPVEIFQPADPSSASPGNEA